MTTTYTVQSPDTMEGFMDTLTGFDELAIAKHFDGLDPYVGGQDRPVMTLRALIMIAEKRKGAAGEEFLTDAQATKRAMEMPLGEANAYFVDEPEALNPDEPESPAGEGDSSAG